MTSDRYAELARTSERVRALLAQRDALIAQAMAEPDRNVTQIAEAAGMTRAGVHHHDRTKRGDP